MPFDFKRVQDDLESRAERDFQSEIEAAPDEKTRFLVKLGAEDAIKEDCERLLASRGSSTVERTHCERPDAGSSPVPGSKPR